jgi:hypothetical protein
LPTNYISPRWRNSTRSRSGGGLDFRRRSLTPAQSVRTPSRFALGATGLHLSLTLAAALFHLALAFQAGIFALLFPLKSHLLAGLLAPQPDFLAFLFVAELHFMALLGLPGQEF